MAGTKDLSRRNFLKRASVVSGAALMTSSQLWANEYSPNTPPNVPTWMRKTGQAVGAFPYGVPSPHESDIVRRTVPWLTASPISSVSFSPLHALKGIITPSSLHFERHHSGIPDVLPNEHRLMIHGLCDNPLILDMDDLVRFPSVSEIRFIECPANGGMEWRGPQMEALQFTHGMLSCSEWTGVRLSTLLAEVGVRSTAKWILAEGADGAAMGRSIPIGKALDDVLVAYAQNGEMIRPEQGYPIRLVNPGWEGNTSVKWLRRIELGDKPWHLREETSKYTDIMPDGSARQFTWVQESNSVITSICPENPLKNKGYHEIEGVAWSGRGKIKHVDVSFDGGISWKPAQLKGLVLDKALTRFSFNWTWDGSPKLIQSRAIDETGYVQPTLEQLRRVRGVNSIYHKNSIHTWQLSHTGEVKNVQRN
jgi:sulfane dehydrogenase subunit SoxC